MREIFHNISSLAQKCSLDHAYARAQTSKEFVNSVKTLALVFNTDNLAGCGFMSTAASPLIILKTTQERVYFLDIHLHSLVMKHTPVMREGYMITGKQAAAFSRGVKCFMEMILPPSVNLSLWGVEVHGLRWRARNISYFPSAPGWCLSLIHFCLLLSYLERNRRIVEERWSWGQIISIFFIFFFVIWKNGQCWTYKSSRERFIWAQSVGWGLPVDLAWVEFPLSEVRSLAVAVSLFNTVPGSCAMPPTLFGKELKY